jgi:hypothetical protein
VEFNEITETLSKIKSGKFAQELGLDHHVEVEPYQYEEEDYFQNDDDEGMVFEKREGRRKGNRKRAKKQEF